MTNKATIFQYAREAKDSPSVGKWIKLAAERFLRFADGTTTYYASDKVDKVINFIGKLKHTTGRHNGEPFLLQPWQKFIVGSIFGICDRQTHKRITRNAYISVSRKNGKTAFATAILLYLLIGDGENGAECDFVATNYKQAQIAFTMASEYLKGLDSKGKYFKRYRDSVLFPHTNSRLQVLCSNSEGLDGFNASAFLLDEAHASMNNVALYNVLKSSQGMRETPLALVITTSGFNLFGECKKYEDTCKAILSGAKEDNSTFAAIFQLDEGDDWRDSTKWPKANPNLDITVSAAYLDEQINAANNNTSLEVGVRTKNLNQWCASAEAWISQTYILDSTAKVDITQYGEVWVGIDLSSVSDLTAVAAMAKDEATDKYIFKVFYFLPRETVENSPNADKYKEWERRGFLTVTDGNVVDYDYILNKVMELGQATYIMAIAYDKWNAVQLAINATNAGLPMQPFSQSLGNFNAPTKLLERLVKGGKVILDNNEITRWCFENVTLKSDWNANVKPVKKGTEGGKIDGVIAIIQALAVSLTDQPNWSNEITI